MLRDEEDDINSPLSPPPWFEKNYPPPCRGIQVTKNSVFHSQEFVEFSGVVATMMFQLSNVSQE